MNVYNFIEDGAFLQNVSRKRRESRKNKYSDWSYRRQTREDESSGV